MTRYTVTWRPGAQGHLAQLWLDAADRPAITEAANTIDHELSTDASGKGMPLSEGLRTLHIPPLHILFTVREQDRLVEVVSVRADQAPPAPQTNGTAPGAG